MRGIKTKLNDIVKTLSRLEPSGTESIDNNDILNQHHDLFSLDKILTVEEIITCCFTSNADTLHQMSPRQLKKIREKSIDLYDYINYNKLDKLEQKLDIIRKNKPLNPKDAVLYYAVFQGLNQSVANLVHQIICKDLTSFYVFYLAANNKDSAQSLKTLLEYLLDLYTREHRGIIENTELFKDGYIRDFFNNKDRQVIKYRGDIDYIIANHSYQTFNQLLKKLNSSLQRYRIPDNYIKSKHPQRIKKYLTSVPEWKDGLSLPDDIYRDLNEYTRLFIQIYWINLKCANQQVDTIRPELEELTYYIEYLLELLVSLYRRIPQIRRLIIGHVYNNPKLYGVMEAEYARLHNARQRSSFELTEFQKRILSWFIEVFYFGFMVNDNVHEDYEDRTICGFANIDSISGKLIEPKLLITADPNIHRKRNYMVWNLCRKQSRDLLQWSRIIFRRDWLIEAHAGRLKALQGIAFGEREMVENYYTYRKKKGQHDTITEENRVKTEYDHDKGKTFEFGVPQMYDAATAEIFKNSNCDIPELVALINEVILLSARYLLNGRHNRKNKKIFMYRSFLQGEINEDIAKQAWGCNATAANKAYSNIRKDFERYLIEQDKFTLNDIEDLLMLGTRYFQELYGVFRGTIKIEKQDRDTKYIKPMLLNYILSPETEIEPAIAVLLYVYYIDHEQIRNLFREALKDKQLTVFDIFAMCKKVRDFKGGPISAE